MLRDSPSFARSPQAVGQSLRVDGQSCVVIGILPRGFIFPATALNFLYSATGRPEFLTLGLVPASGANANVPQVVSGGLTDEPVIRLEPGVTVERAQAEIDSLVNVLQQGRTDRIMLVGPRAVLFPTGRPIMTFLTVAAALVLLIGCANLANMLLVRSRRREREIGMRAALGASRLAIVRPIVFETVIIGLVSAAVALLVTAASFDFLLRQVPPITYRSAAIQVDGRVASFALILGLAAGFAFAVVPAWWSTRCDILALLKAQRPTLVRRRIAFGHPMVVVQVAVAAI